MKMHPPAQVNARVTEEMLRWIMSQPIIVTIPKDAIPKGMFVSSEFHVTPGKDAKDYPIDDRTKEYILYELQRILSFHRFHSELLDNGSLKISKERWTLEVEGILNQLPFAESLLVMIENSYNHHTQDAAFNEMVLSGGVMMQVDYGQPRPSHFTDMSEILKDSIDDTDKD